MKERKKKDARKKTDLTLSIKKTRAAVKKQKPIEPVTRKSSKIIRTYKPDYKKLGPKKYLNELFIRNGYLRMKDEVKAAQDANYKKGYEVRFVAFSIKELKQIRTSIRALGFTVSNSYEKHNAYVQPIYGKPAALKFLELKNKNKDKIYNKFMKH